MSKLLYTHFTKLIIDYLLSLNKSIPHRSDSKLHSSQDDHPITKLSNTTNGDYKFGMEVLDAMIREGSSATQNKYYSSTYIDSDATLYSSSSDKLEGSANETDDDDESDMDLSNDNPDGDDDYARYGVFMHNKSTTTPNSTYLGLMVTSSSLDFIQTLLDETPAN
ncbi:hypothetical protein Tco_0808092 [Tanacetum coccineum]